MVWGEDQACFVVDYIMRHHHGGGELRPRPRSAGWAAAPSTKASTPSRNDLRGLGRLLHAGRNKEHLASRILVERITLFCEVNQLTNSSTVQLSSRASQVTNSCCSTHFTAHLVRSSQWRQRNTLCFCYSRYLEQPWWSRAHLSPETCIIIGLLYHVRSLCTYLVPAYTRRTEGHVTPSILH